MRKDKNTKETPALQAGLFRYQGKIYSIYKKDTWNKIPADIRQAFEDDFKDKIEEGKIKIPKPKKVIAETQTFKRTIRDEKTGKKRFRIEKIFKYKFEDGKRATESDFNKYIFTRPKSQEKEPLIDYRVINNSVLTQIEKSLSEGKETFIRIKGKKTRVTLKNILKVREKIKRLLRKEKKEQGSGNNKDNYLLAFFNVKEFTDKTTIDFHGINSDKYDDFADEEIG